MTAAAVPSHPGAHPAMVVLGLAAGALGAAVVGTQHPALPAVPTVVADLHLTAGARSADPAPTVAPVSAEPTSAAATVPELTKAGGLAARAHKVDAAVDRFESTIGSTGYENWCERAVEMAYGAQGRYPSAIQDWQSQQQHSDWRHAPRGALVFYRTSSDGHVALSLGDGRVVSTSAHHQVGIVPVDYFQHPLGWAYPPY